MSHLPSRGGEPPEVVFPASTLPIPQLSWHGKRGKWNKMGPFDAKLGSLPKEASLGEAPHDLD
ncbi:MAG: hypothetical protein DRI99_05555 [Candidatus Aminicenantes bacterium]|nr:MAG: hypothetical protein DRJ11_11715 [Candidatus Aminicenantes bacterium]RLE02885.1 MAG: hypothetical protein DRI99_05555 [Candidatus Aminicenantes bacterium]